MDYNENFQKLLKNIDYKEDEKSIRLKFNKDFKLLPLQNRDDRPPFNQGLKKIIGEFSRIILKYDMKEKISPKDLINEIKNNEQINYYEYETYFELFIQQLLFNNDENTLSILHPMLYRYVPRTPRKNRNSDPGKGEHQVALFFRDVFYQNNENIYNYFSNSDTFEENIIIKMIKQSLPNLDEKEYDPIYIQKLTHITSLFEEDINYAIKDTDFFDENIENIFAYYIFYYNTQMCLKLFETDTNLHENEELYYTLDNEIISKNRKTRTKGYGYLDDNNEKLLFKMYTIDYVNILLGTKGLILTEILEHINNLIPSEQEKFREILIKFINIFISCSHSDTIIQTDNFEELIKILYDEFTNYENYKKERATRSRYPKLIEELGKKYFLKNRGKYGYILNLKQDMLLTITALCIKKDKIKLKNLFEEYERRGIFLDYKSKKEVENLLNKLNFIDKKSDSGDAQYVRSIL